MLSLAKLRARPLLRIKHFRHETCQSPCTQQATHSCHVAQKPGDFLSTVALSVSSIHWIIAPMKLASWQKRGFSISVYIVEKTQKTMVKVAARAATATTTKVTKAAKAATAAPYSPSGRQKSRCSQIYLRIFCLCALCSTRYFSFQLSVPCELGSGDR